MADLSHLIFRVRSRLSDVPNDWDDDVLVYNDLKDAYAFVNMVAMDDTDETYLENCTVNLAAFYNYLTYTSMAERRLGEMPPTSLIKLDALRSKAKSCLSLISKYPLLDDLSIDLEALNATPVVGDLSPSILG